jgi:hypothetical protein
MLCLCVNNGQKESNGISKGEEKKGKESRENTTENGRKKEEEILERSGRDSSSHKERERGRPERTRKMWEDGDGVEKETFQ